MLLKEAGWNISWNDSVKYSESYLYHKIDPEYVDGDENFANHCYWPGADDAPEGGVEAGEGAEDQPDHYAKHLEGKQNRN